MIYGSEIVEEALRGPHNISLRAQVWHHAYKRGNLDVVDGAYRISNGDLVRRTGTIEVPNSREVRDLLVPGVAVRLWRGVEGVGRPIPIMWAVVGRPSRDGATLSLPLTDLARRVGRHGFLTPAVPSPARPSRARSSRCGVRPSPSSAGSSTSPTTAAPCRASRGWRATPAPPSSWRLATSIGCETFLRPDGWVVLRRIGGIYSRPVWSPSDDLLIEADAEADIEEVVNSVAVQAEHPSGARHTGSYTDAFSDTGTSAIGTVTRVVRTAVPTSKSQCDLMARAIVTRTSGARVSVDYEAKMHPGVEAGDVHGIRTTTQGRRRRYSVVIDDVDVPDLFGVSMRASGRVAKARRRPVGSGRGVGMSPRNDAIGRPGRVVEPWRRRLLHR